MARYPATCAHGEQTARHFGLHNEIGALEHELRDALVDWHEHRGDPESPDKDILPGGRRVGPPERSGPRSISFPECVPGFLARLRAGQQWAVEFTELLVDPFEPIIALCEPEIGRVLREVADRGYQHADERDNFEHRHFATKPLLLSSDE